MRLEQTAPHKTINGVDLLLILLVTFTWGINYPIMKFVISHYPPASFRTFSFLLGCLSLGLYSKVTGQTLRIPKPERALLFRLALPNMVLWHLGLIYGIALLHSGRAAIVGYTMPVWAYLFSLFFFKAEFNYRIAMGVVCSLGATLLLAQEEFSHFAGQPLGLLFTLLAALSWGLGTAMTRHAKFSFSVLAMTFWMLFLAFVVFAVLALMFEYPSWRWPNELEWLGTAYSGVVTFAISYLAWFKVARKLSPVASGLSIMLVPILGLTSGWLILGEQIAWSDIAALVLILAAMALVLWPTSKPKIQAQA